MNFFRKAASVMLAVLLCTTMIAPVFATEVGEDTATQQTQTPETENQQTAAEKYYVNFTEVNETVYAMANVNIRMGPGTQYKVLKQLQYGYSVTRIGVGDNGWSMVLWEDQVVYIFSSYLSTIRPQGYNVNIDDSALLYQVAIANGLTRADYTKETWQVLNEALIEANNALNGNSQAAADDAEEALAEAIDALVKMDYTGLEEALSAVDQLTDTDEMTQLWYELASVARTGRDLLTSGNQAEVDATTEQIHELIALVREELGNLESPDVVFQEVPVEVPPTDKYCNIPLHRVWPVLFFISLVLNVALVAVIVVYIHNKKKNQQDDTPLVDYDIFDDTF